MFFMLVQAVVSGIVTGCIYALVALSLVIVYKATDVVNFGGGEFAMVGGFVALFALLLFELPLIAALAAAIVVTFVIGAAFNHGVMNRVSGRSYTRQLDLVPTIVATIGLSYVLKGAMRAVPYTEEPRRIPPMVRMDALFVGDIVVQAQDVVIVAATGAIMAALWAFFRLTMWGRALRAMSQNARAAALVGMPIKAMRTAVWGLSGAIAAIAGVLLAPKMLITPDLGQLAIMGFAAAIIGGFTSLPGCVIGGILVGILQNLMGVLISPQAITVTPFFVIMAVLLLRPQGLFGEAITLRKV